MIHQTDQHGPEPVTPLPARRPAHRFVVYGDSCSGVPGGPHEKTFQKVNAVVRRLVPQPDFIIFPGDEIVGLTPDLEELRRQWRHWLEQEMGWLDRRSTPIWHTTGNHTVYNEASEGIFKEILNLPPNGPPGQEGLSYWIRRDDLFIAFVNTVWSGLGGEGHVETDWLCRVLDRHSDAKYKFVVGHHPVFPVNGFSGPYQREIGPEHATAFWRCLVESGVFAYWCSHILAFDVQVHEGVLQICTAGAGTAHRMPEGIEYLHCVAAVLDEAGLRYQVLDTNGVVRERLSWPLPTLDREWRELRTGENEAPLFGRLDPDCVVIFRFKGWTGAALTSTAQTLLSMSSPGLLEPLWIGLRGPEQRLTAVIGSQPGRSPHYWLGPGLDAGREFDLQLLVHPRMGPGGLLYRFATDHPWSSLSAASATGAEQLHWPERWCVGHGQNGFRDRPFGGAELTVCWTTQGDV